MKNIFCRYLFNKISKNKGCKESGFTLLELIIVIILLGVMAVGITGFITLSTQTYLNVTERDELLASARFAVKGSIGKLEMHCQIALELKLMLTLISNV